MTKLGPNSLTQVFTEIKNWVVSKLSSKANDSDVVHTTGNEIVEGTKTFSSQIKGNISGSSTSCTGNSASATKLATARTISLTGAVTGSVSFNGSANASISTTLSNIDASKITSGTIDIARIPKAALAEIKIVADDDARFTLTTADIQNGDTVKVESTGKMYYVKDQTKLSTEDGYAVYTADQASSVDWSGVINKPTTFTPSSHTHGKITNDGKIGTAANKPLITTTGGVVTIGSFGTAANTFCQGNDSRLSDARTPKAHTHAKSDITDFPTLATVATSGSYTDLSNKPTIPTVNNATLTIQKNGTTVKTFTANSSANVTANIVVPTKTSELTNDSGFLTSHSPVDSSLSSTSTNAIQNKVVNAALNNKANDSDVVHKSGDETIDGVKTFSGGSSTKIILQNTRMVNGQDDTVNRFWSISLTDKNNGENARILRFVNADNSSAFKLYEHYKGDSKNQVTMGPGHTQDGQGFVSWDAGIKNNTYPLTDNTYTLGTSTLKWKAVYANTFNGKLVGNADTATKATKDASGNVITDTYATKKELGSKADDANVVHKSGTETIAGTKTFSSQIKGNISGTSSDVVVGSDTATARGYLVDGNLPWYKWEEGSQLIAGRVPLITDFNNLTKPGVYHVVFCLNDGFVHEEKEYKESLNRPSIPNITTGFRDGILEIKETTTMHTISSYNRFVQKLTVLSGATTSSYIGLTYQRVFSPYGEWTAWKRVARDEEVVHTSGNETIAGSKTFSENRTKFYKSLDLYHDEDYKLNKNPSVKAYQYVFFTGKSGWHSAFLENQVDTDGASYCNLSTRNTNEQSAAVQLAIDSNGVKTFKPATNNDISLGASTDKWKDVYATTFHGNLVGNAATATKATNNASGNELSNNIIKGLSVSGKVITYTKLDGSTGTITTQDTNTWTAFKGATSSANGTAGYVPAPTKGNQDKFFKADGTWATPTNTTYSVATTSKNGLMSSTDKTKLDGLSNYTLPTASSTLGGVKTTSTVTSTSGLTACPIISGVVYYKDTNTDVKVTNTLNNTTKAYITGTTSATTNTGTQIFDSGVYLTTTAGQLHADIDFPITEAQVNKILGIS